MVSVEVVPNSVYRCVFREGKFEGKRGALKFILIMF